MRIQPQLHHMLLQQGERPTLAELLKVGDRVEATVLRIAGDTAILRLAGETARVANTSDLQLVPGETLVLEMTSREGDVLVARPAGEGASATPPSDQQVVDQVMRTLDVPPGEESAGIVRTMIRGELPLTREAFQSIKLGQFMTREIVNRLNVVAGEKPAVDGAPQPAEEPVKGLPVKPGVVPREPAAGAGEAPRTGELQRSLDLPLKEVFRALPSLIDTLATREPQATFERAPLQELGQLVQGGDRLTEALVLLTKMGDNVTLKQLLLLDQTVFAKAPATQDLSALVRGLGDLLSSLDLGPSWSQGIEETSDGQEHATKLLERLVQTAVDQGRGEEAERLRGHLDVYREKMDFLMRVQEQYHFVHLPLIRDDRLYGMDLLVKKRGNRKDPEAPITLYVGLDTHHLDRVKVLFTYEKGKLDLTFKLRSGAAVRAVEAGLKGLEDALESIDLTRLRIRVVLDEEPSIKEAFFDGTPDAYATIDARV